jgi:AbrB family looped-hinge helix DNA binding protein
MAEVSKVGKRGTVVIPVELRRRFGIEEGSLVIAEACEGGVLIRPAIALPSDEYRRQFLAEMDHGYAALREDPVAWEQELAERGLLEGTLLDGLDPDEVWTEDGEMVLADDGHDVAHR